jgi:hypothetical protein
MQSTTKIGAIEAEYPYLPQVRSWGRYKGCQAVSPGEIVGFYISKKFGVTIQPCNWNMPYLNQLISQWIDSGRVTRDNCPELYVGAECKN